MKLLPPDTHLCYLDNLFTRDGLLSQLRKNGYAACGTAKPGSGIQANLVTLREVSKKNKNWGMRTVTTIRDEIMCMAWQDNNTVLFMSTAHSVEDTHNSELKALERRINLPKDAGVWVDDKHTRKALDFPLPVNYYNTHMGGSDGCAHQRSYYSASLHRDSLLVVDVSFSTVGFGAGCIQALRFRSWSQEAGTFRPQRISSAYWPCASSKPTWSTPTATLLFWRS